MLRIIKITNFFLLTLFIMVFSITISAAEVQTDEQIPAEKIEQFVDVYKRIKEDEEKLNILKEKWFLA